MMQIVKEIPAKTKTYQASWCTKDFFIMSPNFRKLREGSKNPMTSCILCHTKFKDGDMIALACFTKGTKGNKALCTLCADKLLESEITE